ncbi:MAG: Rv1355c family protein [Myxococcales bacterium]|nr:Rv1355c family protein [Myxococcales bacterium]MCB9714429.1 Rv1355c family protein [Myxococcales bacterium]
MMIRELLRRHGAPDLESWRPEIFDPSHDAGLQALRARLGDGSVRAVHDAFEEQVAELVAARDPGAELSSDRLRARVERWLDGREPERCGAWVYYPWSGNLVHLLARDDFRELRSNRNRNKISAQEQAALRERTIAVIGLSVGQSSAVTLAQEGVAGRFRLADFDRLSLSNMNRLRASVWDLGINKCVLAARQMLELDPFLEIELFDQGATADGIDAILGGDRPVDLLVEECDSLHIKVLLREHARRLRVPVVMETSDRGLIDIERFDLEPERPSFHGLIGEVDAGSLAGLSTKEKLPFVLRILGETAISDRLAGSLFAIGETLETWPQLGSSVALGGACVTDVARRILLGELRASGRFYVDLHELIREGAQAELAPPEAPYVQEAASAAVSLESLRARRHPGQPPPLELVRALVEHGMMAPSGGNAQPWRFHYEGDRISTSFDPEAGWTTLDFEHRATYLSFGSVCENMELTARALGVRVELEPFPAPGDPSQVFALRLTGTTDPVHDELVDAIGRRATNRQLGDDRALDPGDRAALEQAAVVHGATLRIEEDRSALAELAGILGRVDRVAFLNRRMHGEIMSEFRWTPQDASRTRDGIDLATLDLSRADAAAFRMLAHWPGMAFLKRMGGSASLEKPSRKAVLASSAVAVLTIPRGTPAAYFEGGRALQRVWLEATRRGVWLQPMAMLPYLLARLEHGRGEGLEPRDLESLSTQRELYRRYFPVTGEETDAMLLRVFYGPAPSVRALRRPVGSALTIA